MKRFTNQSNGSQADRMNSGGGQSSVDLPCSH